MIARGRRGFAVIHGVVFTTKLTKATKENELDVRCARIDGVLSWFS